jgi:CRP/FNR family cyclic AMP-dependent transcriptional regulator
MATRPSDPVLASEALRACRLFAGLDERTFEMLADALRIRRFRRGEVVFHAGDPGDALFVVATGGVKILVPAGDGSEAAILTTIGPGGFFGELALLDGAPRSATAVALGPVESYVLRREAFDRLVDAEPSLRHALLAALAGEIRRLTGQVEDLHFLDLPGRLARHLLRLVEQAAGTGPTGAVRLAWPFTQAELAGMIGGSRQSVNRLLADFVDRGLLRFEDDALVVPDPDALAEAARR